MQTDAAQQNTHKDVYKLVTDRIIEPLEKGTVPWQRPWRTAGIPRNAITGRPYKGLNALMLACLGYEQNLFLTYSQVNKELKGRIKQGEHGHVITWWKSNKPKEGEVQTEDKAKAYLRYYTVFNISQCEGIPEGFVIPQREEIELPACEDIVKNMPQCPEIKHKSHPAFYHPIDDFINMPKRNAFNSDAAYYSTLFHELVHSTGHYSRLRRKDLIEMSEFGSEPYSHEELVAEIGTCFLQSVTGIESEFQNSAGYIQGWLSALKNDKRFILSASAMAQKAIDFILNISAEDEEEVTE